MTIRVLFTVMSKPGKSEAIMKKLRAQREVLEAHTISDGKFDVIAWIGVPSLDDYRGFIEKMAEIPEIDDFESFITVDN
jgi:DNA-binding Lrp family transcriptional regulator